MSSSDNPSQYVKLKAENITSQPDVEPGELNQPVEVPQLDIRRCIECGQTLPQEYEPPQDEPWSTGICSCADDMESCWIGAFCPCVLFGRNVEAMKDDIPWTAPCLCHAALVEGGIVAAGALAVFGATMDPGTSFLLGEALVFGWWMCGIYTGLFRQELQKKYHLKNSPCDPCCVHCCLHPCALCQEHREMRMRLPASEDESSLPMAAPKEQEMAVAGGAAASSTTPEGAASSGTARQGREPAEL